MSKKTIMGSFVNQFAAAIKGDTAEATAEKAWRQAKSALQTGIARLEGDTINFEDKVTTAEENLAGAKINNAQMITDRDAYLQNILNSEATLKSAKKVLENHLLNLNVLRSTLVELETA